MPTLQDGTIRAEVAAPVAVPYRFGLFSVAVPQPTTETRWEAGGITWVSELCTQPGFTTNACVDPDVAALANPDTTNCVVPVFDPFTVYTVVDPSAGKMSADVAATTARNRLAAVEQFGVEASLWALLAAAEPTPVAASTPTLGLALVEQMLAEAYPATGVIHMSRLSAMLLPDQLRVEGNRLVTLLGTPVVAGGGYDEVNGAEPSTATIFGSGPLVMPRSEVQVVPGFNQEINSHFTIAQRTYAVGWDCGVVGATITV